MALLPPPENWDKEKPSKDEKTWVYIALLSCLFMFFWMIGWHIFGKQNTSFVSYKVNPMEFFQLYNSFVEKYKIGEKNGTPVVKPPPESDVILLARMWSWSPILVLEKDKWYTFHISSLDLQHGFSLQPVNMNFQVIPGYDHVLKFKPTKEGEYSIICNEFCGIGHHLMIGKVIVIAEGETPEKYLGEIKTEKNDFAEKGYFNQAGKINPE
ncbi:Cytochrome c oxidase subunit 2 [bacterium HR19]|nr:Cytochrome c oxidase subunit 2 [bacterium HR19]